MNAKTAADVASAEQAPRVSDAHDERDSGVIPRATPSMDESSTHDAASVGKGASSQAARSGEHDIEVDADEMSAGPGEPTARSREVATRAVTSSGFVKVPASARSSEEETFEISDDELEPAERPYVPAGVVLRHRPPPPPSLRPRARMPSSMGPMRPTLAPPFASRASTLPAKGRAVNAAELEEARWQLANRTLELTRARARISELEAQLARRDEQLRALERQLSDARAGASVGAGAARGAAADESGAARTSERSSAPHTVPVAGVVSPEPPATVPSPLLAPQARGASPSSSASPAPVTSRSNGAAGPAEGSVSVADEVREADEGDAEEQEDTSSFADPEWASPDSGGELGRIAGIGPMIARTLRAQGITRLSQIASWSDDDIRRIAKAIKVPKSRISRGRWVQKAREALRLNGERSSGSREEESPSSRSGL